MQIKKKIPEIVFTSWLGAKYLDRWMGVHVIGGMALGLVLRSLGLSLIVGVVLTAVLLALWEQYESAMDLFEPVPNKILDVVFGVVGVIVAYQLLPQLEVQAEIAITMFLMLLWGALSMLGWYEWHQENKKGEIGTVDGKEQTTPTEGAE